MNLDAFDIGPGTINSFDSSPARTAVDFRAIVSTSLIDELGTIVESAEYGIEKQR